MARIIESSSGGRRLIKLSTADVISVVQEYQQLVHNNRYYEDIYSILNDKVIFLPEEG